MSSGVFIGDGAQVRGQLLLDFVRQPANHRTDGFLGFGWWQITDVGDITAARGTEMYLPIWLRLWGVLGTGVFNVKVVK